MPGGDGRGPRNLCGGAAGRGKARGCDNADGRGRGGGWRRGRGEGGGPAEARGGARGRGGGLRGDRQIAEPPVVITVSGGEDLAAAFDPAFGRAERFLLVDPAAGSVLRVIDNPSTDAAHGAGIQAANLVGSTGAKAVISGRFGPKAVDGLRAQGVSMYETKGVETALDALNLLRSGSLQPR